MEYEAESETHVRSGRKSWQSWVSATDASASGALQRGRPLTTGRSRQASHPPNKTGKSGCRCGCCHVFRVDGKTEKPDCSHPVIDRDPRLGAARQSNNSLSMGTQMIGRVQQEEQQQQQAFARSVISSWVSVVHGVSARPSVGARTRAGGRAKSINIHRPSPIAHRPIDHMHTLLRPSSDMVQPAAGYGANRGGGPAAFLPASGN
ncbi:hypothetical protein ANO11243_024050 [Dothideomycetidae sp. 11243]|nr:hypothetical protein ANO11243_024050 [fungal sp. No.11243]